MKATEKVSQETMPWSISSTKAVRVKDSRSPKLQDNTHTQTHTNHRKPLSSRWLGAVYSCKAQMAWNTTRRNERSAEIKREVVERRKRERKRGQTNIGSMPQLGFAEGKKNRDRERRKKWERGLRCSADRPAFKKNSGGHQKASRSRAAQCSVQSGPESYIIE